MKHKGHLKKEENGIVDPEQGWIVSNKFLFTNDNWKTTKSLFGKFTYKGEERWGACTEKCISGGVEGVELC